MSLVMFDEQCHQLLAAGMVNLVKAPDKRAVEVEHPRPLPASIMTASKRELYRDLVAQFKALRAGEPDPVRGGAQAAFWSTNKLSGGSAVSGVNRESNWNRVPQ